MTNEVRQTDPVLDLVREPAQCGRHPLRSRRAPRLRYERHLIKQFNHSGAEAASTAPDVSFIAEVSSSVALAYCCVGNVTCWASLKAQGAPKPTNPPCSISKTCLLSALKSCSRAWPSS